MFPHVVTVFNSYEDDDLKIHNSITILRGVLLDVSKGTNVAKTGLADADAATLYIPFSVDAVSTTGDKKTYVGPKAFYAAADQQGLWTLDSGGPSNSTHTHTLLRQRFINCIQVIFHISFFPPFKRSTNQR